MRAGSNCLHYHTGGAENWTLRVPKPGDPNICLFEFARQVWRLNTESESGWSGMCSITLCFNIYGHIEKIWNLESAGGHRLPTCPSNNSRSDLSILHSMCTRTLEWSENLGNPFTRPWIRKIEHRKAGQFQWPVARGHRRGKYYRRFYAIRESPRFSKWSWIG